MSEEADLPSPSKALLQSYLNKIIKVKISDGRRLIGSFLCTDQEMNIILGSCQEFVYDEGTGKYKLFNNLSCIYNLTPHVCIQCHNGATSFTLCIVANVYQVGRCESASATFVMCKIDESALLHVY